MKSARNTPECCQDLENVPGLANKASRSESSSRSQLRPNRKSGRVLQERHEGDSCNTSKIEEREVLFDITVEVEDGREVHIQMKEGDSAQEIASKFCEDQNLPSLLVAPLTEHIVSNIEQISNFKDDHCRHYLGPNYGHELDEEYMFTKRIAEREKGYTRGKKGSKERTGRGRERRGRVLQRRTRKKPKQQGVSERLMSFTFSRSAKMLSPAITRKKNLPPLTDKQKALSARLHAEYDLYKERRDEERRIFMDSYDKQLLHRRPVFSKKSRKIMKVRELAAKNFGNYGELLYREALVSIQRKEHLIALRQEEVKESEMRGVTGRPAISKLARNIKQKAGKVWERLQKSKRNESRLQKLRDEAAARDVMECTFKPQLNSTVPPDIKEISLGTVSRFDLLFWDAESRKKRQEKYTGWYPEGVTFRPTINKPYYHEHSCLEARTDSPESVKRPVFSRLLEYAAKLTRRKQQPEQQLHDKFTGQKLFQPKTGRGPHKRNEEALPIGEFLYKLHFRAKAKQDSLEEQQKQQYKKLANYHYAIPKSEELVPKFEQRNFQQLFNYLDDDKDGYIQLTTVKTKDLKEDVVLNIKEATKTQSESDKPLPFQRFIDLMLTVQRKRKGLHLIMSSWRKKTDTEKQSYKLKLNQRSRALAAKKRDFSSRDQWYKIILSDRERVKEKIEALRRQREMKEISQCTFKPAILGGPGKPRPKTTKPTLEGGDVQVEEHGQDDVHGYIFKETHIQGAEAADTLLTSYTHSESDSTPSNKGLFNVWKRFVAKPAKQRAKPPAKPRHQQARKLVIEKQKESRTFLSGIPEP